MSETGGRSEAPAFDTGKAMDATVELAELRGMQNIRQAVDPWLSYSYVKIMQRQMRRHPLMDPGKRSRWLGWAQCAVVASGCASSSELHAINKGCGA